jgi:hypothetical protein
MRTPESMRLERRGSYNGNSNLQVADHQLAQQTSASEMKFVWLDADPVGCHDALLDYF